MFTWFRIVQNVELDNYKFISIIDYPYFLLGPSSILMQPRDFPFTNNTTW